jgi:hypothetical protein
MGIYLALLVPIVIAIILFVFFKQKTQWWEVAIPVVASFLMILIAKAICVGSLTSDTEWFGGYVNEVQYYEFWDEEVSCRHDIPCSHPDYCKDSNGKEYQCGYKHFNDGYRHAYDVDDHPEHWEAVTTLGDYGISKERYDQLVKKFGTGKTFVDMKRDYHETDGDMYSTIWGGTDETLEPVAKEHSYENRPAASRNVLHFQELDSSEIKQFKPFDYPQIYNQFHQDILLGVTDPNAHQKLQAITSRLGKNKQIRIFLLVFKNQSREAGFVQERYWQGGNKNELVICIGIDNAHQVKWGHVFSWSEETGVMIKIKNQIEEQSKLDVLGLLNFVEKEVNFEWKRRQFKEFDYINIEPSANQTIIIWVLTVLLSGGLAFWVIVNEFEVDKKGKSITRY